MVLLGCPRYTGATTSTDDVSRSHEFLLSPVSTALFKNYGEATAAATRIEYAAYQGPSVMKEIIYGIFIGLFAGGLWKMRHWNYQKRTEEFYDLLEKGVISVVVEDE